MLRYPLRGLSCHQVFTLPPRGHGAKPRTGRQPASGWGDWETMHREIPVARLNQALRTDLYVLQCKQQSLQLHRQGSIAHNIFKAASCTIVTFFSRLLSEEAHWRDPASLPGSEGMMESPESRLLLGPGVPGAPRRVLFIFLSAPYIFPKALVSSF